MQEHIKGQNKAKQRCFSKKCADMYFLLLVNTKKWLVRYGVLAHIYVYVYI